tara:strand:- start:14 stop:523 length:510 start_codon:yes stop_codon:yes gene_type:complete
MFLDKHRMVKTVHSEIKQQLVVEAVEVSNHTVELEALEVDMVMQEVRHHQELEHLAKDIVVVIVVIMHMEALAVVELEVQEMDLREEMVELAELDFNMTFLEVISGMQLEEVEELMQEQVVPVVQVLVDKVDQIVDSEVVVMVQRIQVPEEVLMDGMVDLQQEMVVQVL